MFANLTGLPAAEGMGFAPAAPEADEPAAAIAAAVPDRPVAPHFVAARAPAPPTGSEVGYASWYGGNFHGRPTANGETFDRTALTAAHISMPLPSYVRVTNLGNNRSVVVRVNDRGPYVGNRLIDVSEHTAELLAFRRHGLTKVKVDYLSKAQLNADDEGMLLASYRAPSSQGTMIASAQPRTTRVAFAESDDTARGESDAMVWLTKPSKVVDRIMMAFDAAGTAED